MALVLPAQLPNLAVPFTEDPVIDSPPDPPSSHPELAFFEDLTILARVNDLPAPYGYENNDYLEVPPIPADTSPSNRAFTLEEEEDLTGALGFLSGITDDPNCITAVCIEESERATSLTVRVAVNKRSVDSGTGVLQQLNDGFEDIFKALHKSRDKIYDAITSMSFKRILTRMRSKTVNVAYRNRGDPFMGVLLDEYVASLENADVDSVFGRYYDKILEKTAALAKQLNKLEKDSQKSKLERTFRRNSEYTKKNLSEIVKDIYNLHKWITRLRNRHAPQSDEERILPRGTLNRQIEKIARYREYSRLLWRMGQKHSILRDVTIAPVKLDATAFTRNPCQDWRPDFRRRLQAADTDIGVDALDKVCKARNIEVAVAEQRFIDDAKESQKGAKIHAEVQIATWYDLNPPAVQPRVIHSSKDACYLCATYLKLHGKYQVHNSHGKLYPGWKVPTVAPAEAVRTKLDQFIQKRIVENVKALQEGRRLYRIQALNESTLLCIRSTSSLGSLEPADHIVDFAIGQRVPCDNSDSGVDDAASLVSESTGAEHEQPDEASSSTESITEAPNTHHPASPTEAKQHAHCPVLVQPSAKPLNATRPGLGASGSSSGLGGSSTSTQDGDSSSDKASSSDESSGEDDSEAEVADESEIDDDESDDAEVDDESDDPSDDESDGDQSDEEVEEIKRRTPEAAVDHHISHERDVETQVVNSDKESPIGPLDSPTSIPCPQTDKSRALIRSNEYSTRDNLTVFVEHGTSTDVYLEWLTYRKFEKMKGIAADSVFEASDLEEGLDVALGSREVLYVCYRHAVACLRFGPARA